MLWRSVERAYVTLMMWVVGRSFAAASRVDETLRAELAHFPVGYRIEMRVLPAGPGFRVQVGAGGILRILPAGEDAADLRTSFKHMTHAFLVFSFQEGTARAFANDRVIADGDVANATRLLRCLNRMEVLILPKWIARRAVKRYPRVGFAERIGKAMRIYFAVVAGVFSGRD